MGAIPLQLQRAAMYAYTRPVSALAALSTGAATSVLNPPGPRRTENASVIERLSAVPMAVVGTAGVVAVLRRRGGFAWLSHNYEFAAWLCAFGGLGASGALSASGTTSCCTSPLLSLSAAGVMAATAGVGLPTSEWCANLLSNKTG